MSPEPPATRGTTTASTAAAAATRTRRARCAEHVEEGIQDFEDCVACQRSAKEEPQGKGGRQGQGGREHGQRDWRPGWAATWPAACRLFAIARTGPCKWAMVRPGSLPGTAASKAKPMRQLRRLLPAAAAALVAFAATGCGKPAEPPAASAAASSAPAQVADVDVTEHVKTSLLQADSLKGADITVLTLKGDVRLIGVLDTHAQVDDALRIARAAEGAHTVHDELTIRK